MLAHMMEFARTVGRARLILFAVGPPLTGCILQAFDVPIDDDIPTTFAGQKKLFGPHSSGFRAMAPRADSRRAARLWL